MLATLIIAAPPAWSQADASDPPSPLSSAARIVELNRGIQAFVDGDDAQAREIFERLSGEDDTDPACHYFLGLIHLRAGLSASDAESGQTPPAETPAAQTSFDQAWRSLEHAARTADSSDLPIDSLLAGVTRLTAEHPARPADEPPAAAPPNPFEFRGRISLGAAYDTNVPLLGDEARLPLSFGRKWDYRLETAASFDLSRRFDKSETVLGESLAIGIGGSTTYGWQPNIGDFDVNLYSGRAWVNWQAARDLYLGLDYEYSYAQLGRDPYVSSNRLTPVVSKIWRADATESGRTDLWYSHDYRNYLERIGDPRLNRDGKYQSVGIRHTLNLTRARHLWASYYSQHAAEGRLLGDRPLSIHAGYMFRDERTRGTEFDLSGHSILAGVEVPLPYRLSLEFDTVLTWEDYAAASAFAPRSSERRDFVQRYDLGLTRTFVARGESEWLHNLEIKLRGGAAVTLQDSNVRSRLGGDIYEYDRAIYGLRLSISF